MQTSHDSRVLAELHRSLIDIVGVMMRPQGDQELIDSAGVELERPLFPLLVIVDRLGPIGVVDLADRVGRDYSTVSRQLGRLAGLDLIRRRPGADRRVSEAEITEKGRAMNRAIDGARETLARRVFGTWNAEDLERLSALMRRFADDLTAGGSAAEERATARVRGSRRTAARTGVAPARRRDKQ